MKARTLLNYAAIILGAFFIAAGFKYFVVPAELLGGGLTGVASLIEYYFNSPIRFHILTLIFNVPLLILGWIYLGRQFMLLSILSVGATTLFVEYLPDLTIVKDPILAAIIGAIFGGVLIGVGTALSLSAGGSGAGFDIVASIVAKFWEFPVSAVLVVLNFVTIFIQGFRGHEWDNALVSLICIFVIGKTIDLFYVSHLKVTLFIVTEKKDLLLPKLLDRPRGVTITKAEGAYTNIPRDVLMTVATRYELAELKQLIIDTDPDAFVNIVETISVLGTFHRIENSGH